MAFETKQMKVEPPVYVEDDMVSKEDLPYSKDAFLQLIKTHQSENKFTNDGVMVIQPTENIQSYSSLEKVCANDNLSCLTYNVSYPSQLILEKHLRTHDDNTSFSVGSDVKIEPRKLFNTPPCLDSIDGQRIYTTQLLSCDEDVQVVNDVCEKTTENIQDIRTENKQQLIKTNYNTEKYKMLINKLVFQNHFVSRINRAKLIGPYFWKSSLLKEELVQYIQPKQFQGKLKLVKCKTCDKVFSRPTSRSNSYVADPPIAMLQSMANKICTNNNGYETVTNDLTWRITCQECSLVYHTLNEYCTHVHRHLNYLDHCNACLFNAVGN